MAQRLGLNVKNGGGNYGRFSVPGTGAVNEYAGIIDGTTSITLGPGLVARVDAIRVIRHPAPFLLLGSDVLRGGRGPLAWNFKGMDIDTIA